MRQGPNGRRPRGRHHGGGGHGGGHMGGHDRGNGNGGGNPNMGNNRPRSAASLRHQTFDSNCIDVRVRGNAWQVHEKYQALARDAQSAGDRVAAENYLQHAEHYFRIIEAINEATAAEQPQQRPGVPGAPGAPVAAFGQQPEMPANYYGAGGALVPPNPPGNPEAASNGAAQNPGQAQQPQAEAQVQRPVPPQQPNPFFANEDTDDQGGTEPLVARR